MFTSANGDRPGIRNFLLMVTDGKSSNPDTTWEQARLARAQGITVMALGIGNGVSLFELQGIVSEPLDANIYRAANFSILGTVRNGIAAGLCNSEWTVKGIDCAMIHDPTYP